MYVDESGDCGLTNSPTRHFILCGLVVHELRWEPCRRQLLAFRRRMNDAFGLKLREEIHASHMIGGRPGPLARIPKHDRLSILRHLADELATMADLNVITVAVDKQGKPADYDVFANAWRSLIQRFENTVGRRNFAGPANPDERGAIYADHTDDKKLVRLLRRMRSYNPVPNRGAAGYRNLRLQVMVEDPSFRDSADSQYVQACDLIAYLLQQQLSPNGYMRKRGGANYFARLDPILCRAASRSDPQGVVRL